MCKKYFYYYNIVDISRFEFFKKMLNLLANAVCSIVQAVPSVVQDSTCIGISQPL